MTASSLRTLTRRVLAAHAKKHQIAGWHEMTKGELVSALADYFQRRGRNGVSARNRRDVGSIPPVDRAPKSAQRTLGGGHLNGRRLLKPSITAAAAPQAVSDSLIAEASDPCWIHIRWTLSRSTLLRAEAALGTQWHQAVPVLRILDVTSDDSGTSQTRVRDVEIHGDVDHWYLPVANGPRTYKVQIGYRGMNGLMFVMAQSNRIQTPRPESHSLQERENRRKRNGTHTPASPLELEKRPSYDLRAFPTAKLRNGRHVGMNGINGDDEGALPRLPVELRLHAELILHGTTDPHAVLKLLGVHIPVSRDGTFSHRFSLPDGRQVIDAVVTTRDGCHQRTIVLGIERNTKELEPLWFDEIEH